MSGSVEAAFWRGKRVLVTGHTGFKGAWLCLLFHRLGADVFGLALKPEPDEEPCLYSVARVRELLAGEVLADMADAERVSATVAHAEPDIVIHFAAQSLVRRAFREPVRTFTTNVMGTLNLLEALRRRSKLEAVLVTTTDKVYLNLEAGRPFTENDALGGFEPYGASKAAAEMVISAYNKSYFIPAGVPLLTARAGNVVGGGDASPDRIVPDVIRAIAADQPLRVRKPDATRPWQHVLDALEGYLLLVQAYAGAAAEQLDASAMAWNFGPADDVDMVRVDQLCAWAEEAAPTFKWVAAPDPADPPESRTLQLDSSRAISELAWRPRYSARQALLETLDWDARVSAGEDPQFVSLSQVDRRFPHLAKTGG